MRNYFCGIFIFLFAFPTFAQSDSNAPIFRGRMGLNMVNFSAGSQVENLPLAPMMTFVPTVLWNFPSFRSRLGVHYLADLNSPYGATPTSGIGFSGYFYPFGLSTVYEIADDGTLFQKSKKGAYTFLTITPVNFNVNMPASATKSGAALSFAAYMIDLSLGGGYDYPVTQNIVLSTELLYRTASAQEKKSKDTISYSGLSFMLVVSMSYH